MYVRKGDLVEVRGAREILATLDENGELEALPFMPEMLPLLGRRFVVSERAEKICDTITYTGSRRMRDAVMFENALRCNGSDHDGCQLSCRFFWKERWIRRVTPDEPPAPSSTDSEIGALAERIGNVRRTVTVNDKEEVRYRCQATEVVRATTHVGTFDPRAYVRELSCGNVSLGRFLRVTATAAVQEPRRKLKLLSEVPMQGPGTKFAEEPLDLQPGDWVQIRSREEIAATLDHRGKARGLWFDYEMLPYLGGTYRVRARVTRFIEELPPNTGKMIEFKRPMVTLEGVHCSGDHSMRRWFCPRHYYPFWRDAWLRRVEAPAEAETSNAASSTLIDLFPPERLSGEHVRGEPDPGRSEDSVQLDIPGH
ncbi:MAG TPA: hypothetical protein VLM85_15120 [Polyangiaceae bacterium]|nr:hypothetical protein [Polyangiaceae bacterium]